MISRHKHGVIVAAIAGSMGLAGAVGAQYGAPAAPSSSPKPQSTAPAQQAQQTPTPPAQTPGASPQNPSASQQSSGSTTMQNPNVASSPIQMPSVLPGKAETAASAFDKLAASGSTFVTKQEADKLDGFDRAFSEADRDKDGKLTKDEFNVAWAIYTGRT